MKLRVMFLTLCLIFMATLEAGERWVSFTLDNDLFVGDDSGYTNGVFLSWYDIDIQGGRAEPALLAQVLLWTLPDVQYKTTVNAYTLGQSMSTPSDITIVDPPADELPYAGLVFLNNSYLAINETYADKISTILGIVGPASGAEQTQKWVHDVIGSDEPRGWDTQLKDELVFQFSRGRIWRSWVAENQKYDILLNVEGSLGTLASSIESGLLFRYGRGLARSFSTSLLNSSRTTNPAAIDGGWFVYSGIQLGYTFNQIFTDGNTYRNSRSIDYDHESIGLSAGFAYAWENKSLTFAISDLNIIDNNSEEELEDLTRYGSITFALKL